MKLRFSGICGKQLEEIDASDGADLFLSQLLGHEGTGTVMDTDPRVTKTKPDDTVVLHCMKGSGINSPLPNYFGASEKNQCRLGYDV